MEPNVGSLDRIVRFGIGLVLVLVGIAAVADVLAVEPVVGLVALAAGAILVGTGAARTCPAYRILGVDTCERT